MMNIQSTGAADAAASAKASSTAKKGGDKSDGFSDALSEFGKDPVDQKADGNASAEDAEGLPQHDDVDEPEAARPRPIIDLRPESLRKPMIAVREGLDQSLQSGSVRETLGNKSQRELTAAEKKLKDALAAAKAMTEKADAIERANGNGDDADIDIDALLAGDGANVELGDILTLLNGHGAAAAMEGMAPAHKGQAAGKRGLADGEAVRGRTDMAADGVASASASKPDPLAATGQTEVSSGEDRLFRFQGTRGDRQSMDMVVGENRGERTAEFRSAGGGAGETVTVLDSRRFLGLAPNASALTSALSGDKDWAAAMQPSSAAQNVSAQNSTGNVVHTLKLQMTPHELGSVTATLKLRGDELSVHLTVDTRAAYRQLSDDSGSILDALRSQGFAVDQVTISIAPSAGADDANNQQTGQNGQQASTQGERQGNANRGQENAAGRQNFEQAAGNRNEAASENQAAPVPGNARPGQLYL